MDVINFWLSVVGNITSIIGFFLTIAVFYGVKSLKSFYVAKATIPQQIKELFDLREKIDEFLNGKFDNGSKQKILVIALDAQVNIKNLSPKLKDLDKSQYTSQIEPNTKSFNQSYDIFVADSSKENARIMNRKLFELLRSIELVVNDDNWRRIQ